MKRYLLGLTAIALVFAGSAFTTINRVNYEYYHFQAGKQLTDASDIDSYDAVESPAQGCNETPGLPCVIRVDIDNPLTPDLASYLDQYSTDADIATNAFIQRGN